MPKPLRSIRTKVASGFVMLILILLFSVGYVYREMEQLSAPDRYETELNDRRKITSQLLAQLYQAEVIGQSLSTGRLNDYPVYKKAMVKVQAATDSLKSYISDSLQLLRIDSISLLLMQKQQNMVKLLRAISNANTDKLYQQNLEQIINQQDSLLTQQRVQRKEVVKNNSYKVKKKRKSFFKRLGEVFVPEKNDSTLVTNVSREFVTDTLTQPYNPVDTVATILKDIQSKVSGKRQEIINEVRSRNDAIRYDGLVINTKINRIIKDIEEEEIDRSLSKIEHEKDIRRSSARSIAWIAIGAVFLSVFFLILIWRDITRSNHYRKELELAKQKAESLLDAREKLMLTITHDIKAPVSSIIGYTDLLSRLTSEERQQHYLANMKSSSDHLLKLVNDLLDFHRLESNKMEVMWVSFNPYRLFEETGTSFTPIAHKKGLDLHIEPDEKLDRYFVSDPFRIRQIATNLLSNALKFTQKGSIKLKATFTGKYLRFTIADTGCGMSEEEQQKIYQEFTRLKSAQGQEGFGLGLSITQKLVTLLEGEINLESSPGKGSTFTVFIPLRPATNNDTEKVDEQPDATPTSKDIKILLIDDDRLQLDLTKAMIGQLEMAVTCCQQPDELFDLLKQENFDILLTDLQMPSMNGFDLLTLLRASNIPQAKTIPVIAVTARSDMDKEYLLSKGFAGCLHKPFSINELDKALLFSPANDENPLTAKDTADGILNFKPLTAFSGDDLQSAAGIMDTFITETRKDRKNLETALRNEDIKSIAETAHKLLPLFTLINASGCLDTLKWLENQREAKSFTEETLEKTERLLHEIENIIAEAQNAYQDYQKQS